MIDLGSARFSTEKANEEGVKYVFCDPASGEELYDGENPVCVYLVGKDSKECKSFLSEIESKYRGKKSPTGSKAKAIATDMLARCTVRFENVVLHGEELGGSHSDAVKFYKSVPWALEQVDEFISERANFLGR